jgi:hypothetical protein
VAKGTHYRERVRFDDPATGVQGWQLTSFPTHSQHFSYAQNNFAPDSKTLLVRSQRVVHRDAPWDLFSVDIEGLELVQLTDWDDVQAAVMGPDGKAVYFTRGGALWRVALDDLREEEIARCDEMERGDSIEAYLSHDGRYEFTRALLKNGEQAVVRFSLDGSEVRIIRRDRAINGIDPFGFGICAVVVRDGEEVYITYDYDGANEQYFGPNAFAHSSWLFGTGKIQGCGRWGVRALLIMERGGPPTPLVEGPYFWHSGSSYDGKWIVADTNWPNEGLWLASVEGRKARPLCRAPYTAGHPQWQHCHACFSPDGKTVVFDADPHGVGQVFVVAIPDKLRSELTP